MNPPETYLTTKAPSHQESQKYFSFFPYRIPWCLCVLVVNHWLLNARIELAVAHFPGITLHGVPDALVKFQIGLGMFRMEIWKQSQHIVQNLNLAIAVRTGANADGWDLQALGDFFGDIVRNEFQDNRKGPSGFQSPGLLKQPRSRRFAFALLVVPSYLVDMLRCKTHMAHDRNSVLDEKGSHFRRLGAPFQFDRLGTCLG
jgi:hypothetical protein